MPEQSRFLKMRTSRNSYKSSTMAKLYLGTLVLLLPALAFAQSASTSSMYQLAIITDVKQLPTPEKL
jgi:hypothetical protein